MELRMTRVKAAELANNLILCSSVTFNEADNRKDYQEFKRLCGRIANYLEQVIDGWNGTIRRRLKVTDEFSKSLVEMDEEYRQFAESPDAGNEEKLKELDEKYADLKAKEREISEAFTEFNNEEVTFSIPSGISYDIVPLNLNGAYLDVISPVMIKGGGSNG